MRKGLGKKTHFDPLGRMGRFTLSAQPARESVHPLLRLQRTVGNQAVGRILRTANAQLPLSFSQPGDIYEREADGIAEQVTGKSSGRASPPKSFDQKSRAAAPPPRVLHDLGEGQRLPDSVRAEFESRLGRDLSDVRVHTGVASDAAARAFHALAFTMGRDIVFRAGQYTPATWQGQKLLAHELGHAMQQSTPNFAAATRPASSPAIMRATATGEPEALRLSASEIPNPVVLRSEGSTYATVYFGQNNFLLEAAGFELLEKLSEELRYIPNPIIQVDGHASAEGTEEYNRELSEKRRQLAIAALRSKLAGKATFTGRAYGESKPAVAETAKTAEELERQRTQNRRVEILMMPSPALAPANRSSSSRRRSLRAGPKRRNKGSNEF